MGRDRQEQKLKERRTVESDRDQRFSYKGATLTEGSEGAKKRNNF